MYNVGSGKGGSRPYESFFAHDLQHSHKFPFLACFQFFVLADVKGGACEVYRIVNSPCKGNLKKFQVNPVKTGLVIRHFSDPGNQV
jgi:hypothetical protein